MDVLGHEMTNVKRLKVHGVPSASLSDWSATRKDTGEASLLKKITGKTYGEQGLTSRDMRKLRRAKKTHVPGVLTSLDTIQAASKAISVGREKGIISGIQSYRKTRAKGSKFHVTSSEGGSSGVGTNLKLAAAGAGAYGAYKLYKHYKKKQEEKKRKRR